MIAVLSPSKTMDFRHPPGMPGRSLPRMLDQTNGLAHLLRTKSAAQLRKLMDVSDALAREAQQHFLNYSEEHSDANTKPAIYAFSGDVYRGLDAASLSDREVEYCERHVRILSGFYGLLRPLDRIQPYRLEMGLALKVGKCPDLYAYWKPHIGKWLSADLAGTKPPAIINLASQEYYLAIPLEDIPVSVIHIHFREMAGGKMVFRSFNAKRARGAMARYMADARCSEVSELKQFDLGGYAFEPDASDTHNWYFLK
jgi:cytoplasmic iron level regulating protein YaaA (DUF328/UPF0246 family)